MITCALRVSSAAAAMWLPCFSQTWDYLQEREISFEEAFSRAVSRWNRREADG